MSKCLENLLLNDDSNMENNDVHTLQEFNFMSNMQGHSHPQLQQQQQQSAGAAMQFVPHQAQASVEIQRIGQDRLDVSQQEQVQHQPGQGMQQDMQQQTQQGMQHVQQGVHQHAQQVMPRVQEQEQVQQGAHQQVQQQPQPQQAGYLAGSGITQVSAGTGDPGKGSGIRMSSASWIGMFENAKILRTPEQRRSLEKILMQASQMKNNSQSYKQYIFSQINQIFSQEDLEILRRSMQSPAPWSGTSSGMTGQAGNQGMVPLQVGQHKVGLVGHGEHGQPSGSVPALPQWHQQTPIRPMQQVQGQPMGQQQQQHMGPGMQQLQHQQPQAQQHAHTQQQQIGIGMQQSQSQQHQMEAGMQQLQHQQSQALQHPVNQQQQAVIHTQQHALAQPGPGQQQQPVDRTQVPPKKETSKKKAPNNKAQKSQSGNNESVYAFIARAQCNYNVSNAKREPLAAKGSARTPDEEHSFKIVDNEVRTYGTQLAYNIARVSEMEAALRGNNDEGSKIYRETLNAFGEGKLLMQPGTQLPANQPGAAFQQQMAPFAYGGPQAVAAFGQQMATVGGMMPTLGEGVKPPPKPRPPAKPKEQKLPREKKPPAPRKRKPNAAERRARAALVAKAHALAGRGNLLGELHVIVPIRKGETVAVPAPPPPPPPPPPHPAPEGQTGSAADVGTPSADPKKLSKAGSKVTTPASKTAKKRPGEEAGDRPSAKKPATAGAAGGTDAGQSLAEGGDVLEGTGVNIEEEAVALRGADAAAKESEDAVEERVLNRVPLEKKLAEVLQRQGLSSASPDMENFLNQAVETYMVGLLERLCKVAKQRMDVNRRSSRVKLTSDMRRQVLGMQRRDQERERQRLLQAEKEKKDQSDGAMRERVEAVLKEEEVKRNATLSNLAVRSAFGKTGVKWSFFEKKDKAKDKAGKGEDKDGKGKKAGEDASSAKPPLPGSASTKSAAGAEGADARAGTGGGLMTRAPTLPPTRAKEERRLTTRDLIVVMERDPYLTKSPRLAQLHLSTAD